MQIKKPLINDRLSVEVIKYLLLYNLHDCTFKYSVLFMNFHFEVTYVLLIS